MEKHIKNCPKCKTDKELTEFHRSRSSKDGRQCWCKVCMNTRNKENKINHKEYFQKWSRDHYDPSKNPERYAKHRPKYLERKKEYAQSVRGRMMTLICSAKSRARRKGLEFSITVEWACKRHEEQSGRCLLTGVEFDLTGNDDSSRAFKPFSPSLDRIDSKGGYTESNTRLVCTAINLALNHFGESVFEKIATGFLRSQSKLEP